jgi:hypothetical protein
MILTINYKNGNTIVQSVHYVHTEDGKLYFTEKRNPTPVFVQPTIVPLKNIINFEVITKEE